MTTELIANMIRRIELKVNDSSMDIRTPPSESADSRTKVTYLGHATILIEMDGMRILTDPLLRMRVGHLRRHGPMKFSHHLQAIDAVLISHLHWDHLDIPSLRLLNHDTLIIVPFGAGKWLRKLGFSQIREYKIGESITLSKITITTTYAAHSGSRLPWQKSVDSLGYLIQGSSRLYFAGDTDIFPEMAKLSSHLDVALLPVWGWGPTLRGGHLNPYTAAQALTLLRPRLAIPIHWGTYMPLGMGWLQPRFFAEPPYQFERHAAQLSPEILVRILPPGGQTELIFPI